MSAPARCVVSAEKRRDHRRVERRAIVSAGGRSRSPSAPSRARSSRSIRTSKEIQGLPAYASIKDAPGPIDQAIIAVPAKAALQAADECIAKGVKAAVMFSSGFAETGAEGRAHAGRACAPLRGRRHEAARPEQPRHVQRPCRALLDLLVLLRSAVAAHRAGRHRQPERRVRHLFPRARGRARPRLQPFRRDRQRGRRRCRRMRRMARRRSRRPA